MKPLVLPGIEYVSFPEFFQATADQRGWGDIPDLHYEMCAWLESTAMAYPRRCLMAFRHAAKTDITSNYVAWRLYLNPMFECLIVSAGFDLAQRNSKYIRTVIETHPLTRHLIPDDDEWKATNFNVRRPVPSLHNSVACKSMTGKITGNHGDEILLDDGEIDENSRTAQARESIAETLQELLSMSDRMLAIGTPHHELTIYNRLQYELGFHMLKLPVWKLQPVVARDGTVIEPGIPAWPVHRDIDWITEQQRVLTTGKWRSQYLLIPDSISDSVIDPGRVHVYKDALYPDELDIDYDSLSGPKISYYIGEDRVLDLRAYWDVATGREGRDNSVVAAVARGESGNCYCVGLEILPPEDAEGFGEQCRAVLRFCKEFYVNKVYVETNFARNLDNELKDHANRAGHRIGISEIVRSSKSSKVDFIGNILEPLTKIRRLYVHERVWKDTPLKQEMSDFPFNVKKGGRHDDCIDALAGAISVLSPHRVASGDYPDLHASTPMRSINPVIINGDLEEAA